MSELRQLWTVESGAYSDRQIHAVFESEADAEAWAAAMRADEHGWNRDASVGRITLVPLGMAPYRATTWDAQAELWDNGKVEQRGPFDRTELVINALYGPPPKRPSVRYVRAPVHANKGGRLEVRGSSEEAVMKVLSERVAMWKAGAWAGPNHKEIVEEATA